MILFLMIGLIMLTMTVSGDPAPGVANFTAIPGSGEAPLTVTFTVHFIIFWEDHTMNDDFPPIQVFPGGIRIRRPQKKPAGCPTFLIGES
jgi:hypothetical protein